MNKETKNILICLILISIISVTTASAYRMIGVTSATYTGNLGNTTGADKKCQAEFGNDYKAIIGTTDRQKGGSDWVLAANTEYRRISGNTVIDVTGNDSCFTYGLDNNIRTSGLIWTGLNNDCSLSSYGNCVDWTDGYVPLPNSSYGMYASSDSLNAPLSSKQSVPCQQDYSLYCASQIDTTGEEAAQTEVIEEEVKIEKNTVLTELQGLSGADKNPLADAIKNLQQSLNPDYWIDNDHLVCSNAGSSMFDKDKRAVNLLIDIKSSDARYETVHNAILTTVSTDRSLAEIVINESPKGTKKTEALKLLSQGDVRASQNKYSEAIDYYKKAWEKVCSIATTGSALTVAITGAAVSDLNSKEATTTTIISIILVAAVIGFLAVIVFKKK